MAKKIKMMSLNNKAGHGKKKDRYKKRGRHGKVSFQENKWVADYAIRLPSK